MQRMPADKAARLNGLVGELRGLPRIAAIALGGSQARALQRPDSDIDIGLYYREEEAFEPAPLRQLANRLDDAGQPVVTEPYEWGRWVNGGAWLSVGGDRVDILYRNIGQIERCIAEAECGRVLLDFDQQPPYGFSSVVYLAEVAACVALDDPQGILARLKERVAVYPPALKEGIINGHLWLAEFTLRYACHRRAGETRTTPSAASHAVRVT
jgi:predicted nucleotidyltransferase